jgi:PAS domain S-box-containing protein
MPDNRKEHAQLKKKIKSLRLRVAKLEKEKLRNGRIGVPPKSDILYQTFMENIPLGISFIDTNHKIITTNAGLGRFFRKPHSEFIGKYCFREFEKRSAICSHCPGTRAMATGRSAEVETEGVRDDGSRFAVHLRAFPVLEADGSIKGFVEVVEDITKRRQTEEKLRESEQRFKTVFDNAADGILLADVENKKIYTGNKMICQMLGYKPEEIKNLAVSDIHPKEHLSFVLEQFEKQARKEIILAEDLPVKKKDGSIFYADINSLPVTLDGKLYLLGIFRDVTEHKRAKEKLRESENKYKTLLENIPQKIFLKGRNSIYVSCNENYANDLNIKPDEITGKTDYDFYPKKLAKKYRADDRRIMESGKTEDIEEKYIKEGQELFIHTVKTPVRDEQGKAIGLLGVFWDITERKKMEEELSIYREKMAQAERLASLGTLSATLAHELTQPLTVIRLSIENSLEDLKAKSCPKSVIEMLRDSLNEVSNATSVVDRFRNYARQSSRKTFCEINVGAIADRIALLLSKTAQRAKMTLQLKGMNKLPPVYSNEKDIEQLFFSLTENAIQAAVGKKNYQLTIEGAVKNKNIELRFSDNCSGIAPENINRIFDPFFTTGSNDGRTGLGLPIVQRILSGYGGKISVRSRPGKGTTFYVTLPIDSKMVK